MKRATTWILSILLPALLAGCDAGKEPLAGAAGAEAAGDLAGAAALYRAVCDKGSALCPIATRQADRLKLAEARKALAEGAYQKAKASIDAALSSTDAGVKRAAEAMSKLPDLEKGVIWEEAAASADQDGALARIEAVAEAGVSASPKAKAWLTGNRPRLLLARVKAACAPAGKGSCVDAGKELSAHHPASPESAEAQRLVEADYARIFPLLSQADRLLGQRAMLRDKEETKRVCAAAAGTNADPQCAGQDGREQEPDEAAPTVASVTEAWTKLLGQVHDPHFVKRLEESWGGAESGSYAPETWPKPVAKK